MAFIITQCHQNLRQPKVFLGHEPQELIKTIAFISTQCHQKLRQPKAFLGHEPQELIKTIAFISTQCHQKLRKPNVFLSHCFDDPLCQPFYDSLSHPGTSVH